MQQLSLPGDQAVSPGRTVAKRRWARNSRACMVRAPGLVIAVALLGSLYSAGCAAGTQSAPGPGGAWTLTLENDSFTGSDNNYTNGMGLSWVSRPADTYDERSFVRRWARSWSFLPFVGQEGYSTYVAWTLAQEMHTPDDITLPNPPGDDQPYAGIVYLDSVVYARGERATHSWQLRLGMVGPSSQADHLQTSFHKAIGSDKPMGWHTQLPDEPIVNVGYTGAWLLAQGDAGKSATWRLVPVANAGLGNYFTGIGLGLYAELGWNLVDALGGTALRQGFNAASTVGVDPQAGWSASLSGGIAGYGVAHYLPLDGTVFRDSRSVDAKPFIGMATLGLNLRYRSVVFFAGRTFFTRTFDTARERAEFGTVSLSWYH